MEQEDGFEDMTLWYLKRWVKRKSDVCLDLSTVPEHAA